MSENMDIKYIHRDETHNWGQRVVRFYDPGGHMIEVGEDVEHWRKNGK